MAKLSQKIDLLLKQANKYYNKAQRRYYIGKLAAENNLLTRLKDYEENIKEESLFEQVEKLTQNYEAFLEETGEHKLHKNTQKISELIFNLRNALNDITNNVYTDANQDGFSLEEKDFDGENFLELIETISNSILRKFDSLGDVPDFDPAAETKQKVIQMLKGLEKDEDYINVKKSGNLRNVVTYLMKNYPEIADAIKEIQEQTELKAEDWKEILEDTSQVVVDPYNTPGGRIVDTQKQKDAKKVWEARNPARLAAQRKRDYANYKLKLNSDPVFREKELSRKKDYYKKYITELEQKAKTDPKAQALLDKYPNRFREMRGPIPGEKEETGKGTEISRFFIDELGMKRDLISEWRTFSPAEKAKYQTQYDALIAQHEQTKEPTYNIQTLRNKFVVIPARTERLRLIKDRLESDDSEKWQKLKEDFVRTKNEKPLMHEIMKDPEYQQFVAQMPQMLKQDKSTRTFREFQRLPPNIQEEILTATTRLRT